MSQCTAAVSGVCVCVLQQRQSVADVETVTLKKLNDGHSAFCSVMADRLRCLTAVQELLQDANFKVCDVCLCSRQCYLQAAYKKNSFCLNEKKYCVIYDKL